MRKRMRRRIIRKRSKIEYFVYIQKYFCGTYEIKKTNNMAEADKIFEEASANNYNVCFCIGNRIFRNGGTLASV